MPFFLQIDSDVPLSPATFETLKKALAKEGVGRVLDPDFEDGLGIIGIECNDVGRARALVEQVLRR